MTVFVIKLCLTFFLLIRSRHRRGGEDGGGWVEKTKRFREHKVSRELLILSITPGKS